MVTYEDLHKLFCPSTSWYEARLQAVTDDQKEEWMLSFTEYCKAVRSKARGEILSYTKGLQGEIDTQRILEGKLRVKNET